MLYKYGALLIKDTCFKVVRIALVKTDNIYVVEFNNYK